MPQEDVYRDPDPTPEELAALTREVRRGWSREDRRRRVCRPEISPWYHLLAVILGADQQTAWQLFKGAEFQPKGRYQFPRARVTVPPSED